MAYRSVDEFRHALAGLALDNPRMVLPDGTVVEDVSREDIMELMKAQSMASSGMSRPTTSRRSRSKRKKKGRRKARVLKSDYAIIGRAIGGLRDLCPGLDWDTVMAQVGGQKPGEGKYEALFKGMGLTPALARAVVAGIDELGFDTRHRAPKTAEEKELARMVLFEVGGVSCPLYNNPSAARGNPGYAIPGNFPASDYTWGPEPRLAHWTSYPQYSYDQFYRPNTPRTPDPGASARGSREAGTGTSIAVCNGAGCPTCGAHPGEKCVTARGNPTRPHAARRRRARRNPRVVPIPPSAAGAEPVPWEMAQNAGPYLPEMYPYGMRGRPKTYALNNPSYGGGLDARCPTCKAKPGHDCVTASGKAASKTHVARRKASRRKSGRAQREREEAFVRAWAASRRSRKSAEEAAIEELKALWPKYKGKKKALPWGRAPHRPWRKWRNFVYQNLPATVRHLSRSKKNPARPNPISEFDRHAAMRAGGTLSGGTEWPVMVPHWSAERNRQQAITALQFMARGFGDPSTYATYVKRLAAIYPPEDSANKPIWSFFRRNRDAIKAKSRGRMPTMKTLRKVRPSRAAANPSRHHLRPRLRRMERVHEDE